MTDESIDDSAEFHPREQRTPDTFAPVAVALSGVTKRYGDQVVLDDFSLRVHEGEFFSILGPSGSGKTTLLRTIAGFVDPELGSIELDGVDMVGVPPYRRDVNTVFQSYALFPHLDVWNNVAYGLRRKGLRGDALRRRVGEHLELVQLSGYARRRPNQLSGGQQQRVAVARALATRPRLLLLDEPLGALDAQLRGQMQVELMRIQREVGTTFLYITHDQEEALVLSHRLAVLGGGRLRQVGYPEDVYERPASRFVAEFLRSSATGAANIIDTEVLGHDPAADLVEMRVGAGGRLRAALPASTAARAGDPVALTVRPEKVHVYDVDGAMSPPTGWCVLPGTIVDIVYTGVSTQYLVQSPVVGSVTLVAFVQNTRRISDAGGPGQPVVLAWDPEHSVLLAEDDHDRSDAVMR